MSARIDRVLVYFGEKLVGTLVETVNHMAAFAYEQEWLETGFPISPFSLPLEKRVFVPEKTTFDGLFGVFADILFDVLIGDNYQPRETVEQVAESFGLKVIPIVGIGPLEEAVWFVKQKPHSRIAKDETLVMEGVVCRPKVELRDRCGNRLIVKIKGRDFE